MLVVDVPKFAEYRQITGTERIVCLGQSVLASLSTCAVFVVKFRLGHGAQGEREEPCCLMS